MNRVLPLILGIAACNGEATQPQSLGEGRHVEFFAWQDAQLCAGTLEHLDTYVEAIFSAIDEPVPEERFIEYTWFDLTVSEEEKRAWPCPAGASGCAEGSAAGVKVSSYFSVHHHELVHAVHLYALGASHPLLHEGLASYYGDPSDQLELTPEEVDENIRDYFSGPLVPGEFSYLVAKYFVGYVIETFGVDGLKDLWAEVTPAHSYDDFRTSYEDTLGGSFDDLLMALTTYDLTQQTLGRCDGTQTPWDNPDLLEVSLSGGCEEDRSIGPTSFDPPAFMLPYVVEVPEDGDYSLLLTGDSTAGNITMYGCGMKSESQYFFLTSDQPEHRVLPAGMYAVRAEVPNLTPAASLQLTIKRLPPAP